MGRILDRPLHLSLHDRLASKSQRRCLKSHPRYPRRCR